jgi:phenylpropionate dioxygenase-like ring-hydroxylating dioxygenase large terminal subunit
LRFIERYDLGWICLDRDAQRELLAKLTSNSEMIAQKVRAIQAYKTWNMEANRGIRPLIDRLLA